MQIPRRRSPLRGEQSAPRNDKLHECFAGQDLEGEVCEGGCVCGNFDVEPAITRPGVGDAHVEIIAGDCCGPTRAAATEGEGASFPALL